MISNPIFRFKEQNMIFLGAWFGKDKPNFHIVFPKIANILNSLVTNGLDVLIRNGENRHITLTLLTFQADNPAKDAILEKEMNACPTCEQERKYSLLLLLPLTKQSIEEIFKRSDFFLRAGCELDWLKFPKGLALSAVRQFLVIAYLGAARVWMMVQKNLIVMSLHSSLWGQPSLTSFLVPRQQCLNWEPSSSPYYELQKKKKEAEKCKIFK